MRSGCRVDVGVNDSFLCHLERFCLVSCVAFLRMDGVGSALMLAGEVGEAEDHPDAYVSSAIVQIEVVESLRSPLPVSAKVIIDSLIMKFPHFTSGKFLRVLETFLHDGGGLEVNVNPTRHSVFEYVIHFNPRRRGLQHVDTAAPWQIFESMLLRFRYYLEDPYIVPFHVQLVAAVALKRTTAESA